MKLVRVGAAVLNQTPLDWRNNQRNILEAIDQARADDVSVLCLPEMCISGYGCEDAFHSQGLRRASWAVLEAIVPKTRGMIVSVGLPVEFQSAVYNCACLIVDGHIAGFVAKHSLPGDGLHYEPRWFKPWPPGQRAMIEVGDAEYPLGDLYFECNGVRIGFEICEDAWVAQRPGADLSVRGVDIILNPSASHFAFGKLDVRKRLVLEGSRAFSVCYVYTNLLGNEAGRIIYDGGALISSGGRLVATGPRFSFQSAIVTSATVDLDENRLARARNVNFRPEPEDEPGHCIEIEFDVPEVSAESVADAPSPWESSATFKEEEFTRAVSLGLVDYLTKSRSHGFVVSLSGGADSAATACLIHFALQLAALELGHERLAEKLAHVPELPKPAAPSALANRLLSTVYQATKNSSDTTKDAAKQVAAAISARHYEFDIDSINDAYVGMVEGAIGRELDWAGDDIALQNIQARARSPGVWLLTNLKNALLLVTSNRSEAAVGYTTMDGDTSGGLSPIGGIDKAFLRQWLRWAESEGPGEVGPIAALSSINVQRPTAELRPQASEQTDEGDLMPYPLLDAVERYAIRDRQTPVEVFRRVSTAFGQYEPNQLIDWVTRFFRLWSRNQWKRERYAPSFHLDDENLDPKTWCRFPILSGGFEVELEALNQLKV